MTRRYYCSNLPPLGGEIRLSEAESLHATRVMRVKMGDSITLFDGEGREAEATFSAVSRRECWCTAMLPKTILREPAVQLELAIALPKPERCKELIERLTEIGVRKVIPIVAQYTQRPPSSALLEKLARIVVESCKQCGRNQLLEIAPAAKAETFFTSNETRQCSRLFAHTRQAEPLAPQSAGSPIVAAIGPEGGWSDEEIILATESGFTPVSLGDLVLRIETAAVVLAARLLA